MKKGCLLGLAIVLILSGCQGKKACDGKDGKVCFSEELNRYTIEEGASITLGVENETIGLELMALWDKQFPDYQGAIIPVVQERYDGVTYLNQHPDVGLVWANEAARLDNWLMPIDNQLKDALEPNLLMQYGESLNHDQFYYLPMMGFGWVFSTNKTMLEALGVDITDANGDGLVDALDTFEKINEWTESLSSELIYRDKIVNRIFDFNFNDSIESMAWLSLGNFQLFESYKAEDPGFESPQFLDLLNELSELGKQKWVISTDVETVSNESGWNSELYLSEYASIFSFVGSWMATDAFEQLTEQDYLFSTMPTFKNETLHPYTLSAGYVVSKDTLYPNACLELLRLIRSDEGLQIFASYSTQPLLVDETAWEESPLLYDNENKRQFSYAMQQGREESMVAFKEDPTKRGWSIVDEIGMMDILSQVFQQEITAEEAQKTIIERSQEWMKAYLPKEEDTKNKK